MNFEIIRQEYSALREYLDQVSKQQTQALVDNFSAIIPPQVEKSESVAPLGEANNFYKGQYKMSYIMSDKVLPLGYRNTGSFQKDIRPKISSNKPFIGPNDVAQKRQEVIISFLKKHGPSNITDIARVVPGCVEKTVQRELAKMITSGLVQRAGEKRWSRYSAL